MTKIVYYGLTPTGATATVLGSGQTKKEATKQTNKHSIQSYKNVIIFSQLGKKNITVRHYDILDNGVLKYNKQLHNIVLDKNIFKDLSLSDINKLMSQIYKFKIAKLSTLSRGSKEKIIVKQKKSKPLRINALVKALAKVSDKAPAKAPTKGVQLKDQEYRAKKLWMDILPKTGMFGTLTQKQKQVLLNNVNKEDKLFDKLFYDKYGDPDHAPNTKELVKDDVARLNSKLKYNEIEKELFPDRTDDIDMVNRKIKKELKMRKAIRVESGPRKINLLEQAVETKDILDAIKAEARGSIKINKLINRAKTRKKLYDEAFRKKFGLESNAPKENILIKYQAEIYYNDILAKKHPDKKNKFIKEKAKIRARMKKISRH